VKASIVNVKGDAITYRATVTVTGPEEVAGMVYVEVGTFTMGCAVGGAWTTSNCQPASQPQHEVTLTTDFYIGRTEVTQAEWENLMGVENNLSKVKGSNLPVTNVSWINAHTFIDKLNERDAGTGRQWRLPTEAEWEYAARGGMKPKNCEGGCVWSGGGDTWPIDVAWFGSNEGGNGGGASHPVGEKAANELGLFDMSGNVSEMVEDFWSDGYSIESQTNPTGSDSDPEDRNRHVIRGGHYNSPSVSATVVFRGFQVATVSTVATVGFRLALTITEPETPTAKPTFFESASRTVSGVWDSAISGIKSLWNSITK
jgi:formylglycine-generating enzyme required for sulfatase activity